MADLQLSVTFLNGTYHGRGDNGTPEWPPSPFRLFQALLAVAAARWRTPLPDDVSAALDWLSEQPPPDIVTPPHHVGIPYQTSVPNNAMDIVAKAWSRGNETSKDAQPSTHKAMKEIRPTYLLPCEADTATVVFAWSVEQPDAVETRKHVDVLSDLASRLFQVGWGLDLVAGHAELSDDSAIPHGDRWVPNSGGGSTLRTPRAATRRFLEDRHQRFLERLSKKTLIPVPPLSSAAYEVTSYRRCWEPAPVMIAPFSLLQNDGSGYRGFAQTNGCKVAGMLRHATAMMARNVGWSETVVGQFVLGHAEPRGASDHQPVGRQRCAYVPLPSLERRSQSGPFDHVGMVRRVLVYVPAGGHDDRINSLRRMLSGCELVEESSSEPQALLSTLPISDTTVRRYVPRLPAHAWASVSPVVLPGHDDRREKKTEMLLRKAIRQAGYADELALHADLDWRAVGFWPGADRVDRYFIPSHLRAYPAYHVRVRWRDPHGQPLSIPGPLILGGGRYAGLGLFAAEDAREVG